MALNITHHKAFDTYYAALAAYREKEVTHEQATRLAFSTLLDALSDVSLNAMTVFSSILNCGNLVFEVSVELCNVFH